MTTTRIVPCLVGNPSITCHLGFVTYLVLVGNPNLNLHLPLLLGRGTTEAFWNHTNPTANSWFFHTTIRPTAPNIFQKSSQIHKLPSESHFKKKPPRRSMFRNQPLSTHFQGGFYRGQFWTVFGGVESSQSSHHVFFEEKNEWICFFFLECSW